MKKPERRRKPLSPVNRFGFSIVGLMFIMLGIGALVRGALHYSNDWGGVVFVPYGIVIGALIILMAFKWGK